LVVWSTLTALALVVGVALAGRTLLASYATLEDSAARQRADQVYRAFAADLRQLETSTRAYAEWDAARAFVEAREPSLVDRAFSAEGLLGLNVDVVAIVDGAGREIYSRSVDRATREATTPAARDRLMPLLELDARNAALRERQPADRLVRAGRGFAGVSAMTIARSDGSNPSSAMLAFARFIDAEEVELMRETSGLPVSLSILGPDGDSGGLPAAVREWLQNGATALFAHADSNERISAYALLRDLDGEPLAVLATDAPRRVRALGLRTTTYVLAGIAVLFLGFGAVCYFLITRLAALQRRHARHRRHAEEQQRLNRRNLIKQAQRDFLTGLPNRLYAHSRIPRLIQKMADSGSLLAVIHLDIDHFKNINESRGHGSGDRLLKIVAKRLRAAVSKSDLVARMGGDEFIIVASLLPDENAVERLARRLQSAIAADVLIDKSGVRVTASMGVALYPRDGIDMETLLKRADMALYQAKEAGRRCHRFFSADMDARISEHAALEQELRRAIGTPQIYLDYQPIIDLRDGRVVSLEALMRWRHPQRGLIPPAQFIPVAEKSGLIIELGQQALKDVLAQQRAWLDADVPVVPVAVNVSALQVERTDFAKLVTKLTAAVGLEPKWVRFEITESAMTKEPEKLIGTLQTLRELGSQVLLDDFGTGYSSLSYLDRLPIDVIKIDRAFVRDLGSERAQSPVIPAVVDMARRLRLKTVAEGVETVAQAALLLELGCDYAQGYFYSKPVLAHHCRSLLEHLRRERPISETLITRIVTA
jgi:diguanylate cyclase (GGDEF)-like protein